MNTAHSKDSARLVGRLSARDICQISVFTALIAVMAQISIPMPAGVPMTLQTLAVPLAGIVLGSKKGTLSALIYVLLGAVGVPVLAGFQGGMGIVLGVTGGFIVSFPLMALCAGLGSKPGSWPPLFGGLILGTLLNYAAGTLWFVIAAHTGVSQALAACVIPFIPTTVIKLLLAAFLGNLLKKSLKKAGLLS